MKQVAFVLCTVLGGWVVGCATRADPPAEDCALPGDEDGDGHADCADPACAFTPDCLPACGDGRLDAGEACDDGNAADGDGCDSNCTVTACGNGVRTAGETCDDGNEEDGDGCDSNCTATGCGNGVLANGEACDDGNTLDGDGCSAQCQREDREEIEPNEVVDAPGNPLQISGDVTVHGSIARLGDLDAFRLVVAAPTVIRFETFTSLFECVAQTTVRLSTAAGAPVAVDGGRGINGCGAIVISLDAGSYIVSVEETGNNATIPGYFLQVDYQKDAGAEAEAPAASGDNDTVATASSALLEGNNAFVFGEHQVPGDVDVYAIAVPPGARIRAEIVEGDRGARTCESSGVDSYLTLYDEAGRAVATDDDGGRGRCSLIDGSGVAPRHPQARNPDDTTRLYYLAVSSSSAGAFSYRLQVTLR